MGYTNPREERKRRNLAAIKSLGKEIKVREEGCCFQVTIKGRKIDFWPLSDTWYSYAKETYGTGIEKLIFNIHAHLEKKHL